jgi:hypothetical protein
MVCKCSLVERLDLLPMAVLLMIGGKLPAQRAKSAHFVGYLPALQAMMIALLDNLATIEYDDAVRASNGGEAMYDNPAYRTRSVVVIFASNGTFAF